MKKDQKPSTEDEILKGLAEFEKKRGGPAFELGGVSVKVTEDKLKAFVSVLSPEDLPGINKTAVLAALDGAGVKFGIDEKEIEDIFTYGSYGVDVPVAHGKVAADGVPAVIEFKFDTTGDKNIKPEVDEHGNVDLKSLNIVTSVEEGALLAVKTPSKPGEKGTNVLGQELPAKEGRDIKVTIGENVKAGDDGMSFYATASGQPLFKENKLSVSAVFEVRSDVNYSTGNVKFKGSVIIRGNVQSDFSVEASDDIDIFGNVEKANIIAGGDIRLMGGIYGGGAGLIRAGGSVTIRSIESAIVEAGQNIVIAQSARHSTLSAGEDIVLQNARGSIMGGKASCGHHFLVSNLGAASYTETIIEIGMNPKIKKTYDEIEKHITDHKVQLDKAVRTVKSLKEMEAHGQPLGPDKVELLKKLVPAVHQLRSSIEDEQAKLTFLTEKIKSLQAGRARIMYKTYPGVKFFSLNASMIVQREINHSSFYEQNEQIIVGPY